MIARRRFEQQLLVAPILDDLQKGSDGLFGRIVGGQPRIDEELLAPSRPRRRRASRRRRGRCAVAQQRRARLRDRRAVYDGRRRMDEQQRIALRIGQQDLERVDVASTSARRR